MPVGDLSLPVMHPVPGVRIGIAEAGVRYKNRRDLVVFELAEGATTAAVFTTNAFCAAPVQLARRHLAAAAPRYLLINTGNANAGTGAPGMTAAELSCETLASLSELQASVLVLRPKFTSSRYPLGLAKLAWLSRLKASTRVRQRAQPGGRGLRFTMKVHPGLPLIGMDVSQHQFFQSAPDEQRT